MAIYMVWEGLLLEYKQKTSYQTNLIRGFLHPVVEPHKGGAVL